MGRRPDRPHKKKAATDREECIELEGTVIENLPNALFRVQLDDTEQVIIAYVAGKMRKGYLRILNGDRVKVEFSPYDLTRARIVFKYR